ncbi:putative prophage phiRv2 integrase [anaerobic digester metagenome]
MSCLGIIGRDFRVKKSLSIKKTLQRIRGEDRISTPKTKGSVRTIRINESLAEKLDDYISKLYDPTRIFEVKTDTLYRAFKRETARIGLPNIRLHDLRHSHASLLINLGTPVLAISKRLGHDSINTTLGTYGHLYSTADDDIAKILDEI